MSINGVPTDGMTHADAVQLIQNSPSPLHLLMRQTTPSDQLPNHTTGRSVTACTPLDGDILALVFGKKRER